jgi:YggT family protein
MGITIIRTLDLVVYALIVILLMKLVIDPREFFFNSALRPVHIVADPILQFTRKVIYLNRMGTDLTPVFAIVVIILFYVFISFLVLPDGILNTIGLCLQKLLMFFIRLFSFSVFVLIMVPGYSKNPVTGFFRKIMSPFEKPFKKMFPKSNAKAILVGAFLLLCLMGMVLHVLAVGIIAESFTETVKQWQTWSLSAIDIGVQALSIYRFIILLLIIAVVISWLALETHNAFVNMIFLLTEPILLPVRRLIPPVGGLDLSPWVASICLWIIGGTFTNILMQLRGHLL